jgi:hypothetical protein
MLPKSVFTPFGVEAFPSRKAEDAARREAAKAQDPQEANTGLWHAAGHDVRHALLI